METIPAKVKDRLISNIKQDGKMRRKWWIFSLIAAGAALMASLPVSSEDMTWIGTPVFLPLVWKQASPTPTITPTPTKTPTPTATTAFNLEDGDYAVDFSNGGYIHFTIQNGGSAVRYVGFYFRYTLGCSWGSGYFSGPVSVINGAFSLADYDAATRQIFNGINCRSTSSRQALCVASDYYLDVYCRSISAYVNKK